MIIGLKQSQVDRAINDRAAIFCLKISNTAFYWRSRQIISAAGFRPVHVMFVNHESMLVPYARMMMRMTVGLRSFVSGMLVLMMVTMRMEMPVVYRVVNMSKAH